MAIVSLGNVCEVVAGQSPVGSSYNASGNGIEFHQGKKLFGKVNILQSRVYTTRPTKFAEPGDILMSVRAPVGPVNFTDRRLCIGRGLAAIRASEKVDKKYLFYFLQMNEASIKGKEGATFASIDKKAIEGLELPLCSLENQRCAVRWLDTAFEKIDNVIALTQNNIDRVELLFNIVRNRSLNAESVEGTVKRLGDFCLFENGDRGKNYPSKAKQTTVGIPFINAGHLTENGLEFSDMNYIAKETFNKLGSGKIHPHDILFCLRGSLGKYASVGELSQGAIASSLVIVRPDTSVLPEYLLHYFGSSQCAQMIEHFRNGAAQPNLSAGSLAKFEIKVPALNQQAAIVTTLGELYQRTGQLKILYKEKLDCLHALKRSMMEEAFGGKVTT